MKDCKGLFGAIFGHSFSARYSYGPPMLGSIKGYSAYDLVRLFEASSERKYEGEVCARCGQAMKDKEGSGG